ncbi:MAG: glutamate--cysteine ligase [Actinomycetota bacterium]|nr:glutamate--cysteine ligase [Actinomycetota bacterium]
MPEPLTLGAEEEFLLADVHSGALVPRAREAVAAASMLLGDAVTQELNLCQIEVSTPVCTTLEELGGSLSWLRQQLATGCRPLGLAPLATGTHSFSPWQDQGVDRSSDRYASMEERYQIVARQQVICGYHVHVTLADPSVRVKVMNRVRPWLPLLLALSANSPFWQGADSGYASYRTQVWQRWPMAGMPPTVPGPDDYNNLVAGLIRSGAIEDATHLYWYIRPSARYPTLEFRVCDVCLQPADAVTLAGLLRALVWTCADDQATGWAESANGTSAGEDYQLRDAVWRAARYGLEGMLVDPETGLAGPAPDVIRSAVARLGPGLDAHDDRARVEHGVERILGEGNGASWQRRVAATVGQNELATRIATRTVGGDPVDDPVPASG